MGIQDHYFPSPDPARGWTRRPDLSLACVLDGPSLSGMALGAPAEEISRFGPPENNRPTRDGLYDYPSLGFEIDTTDGRTDGFLFRWDAMDPAKHFKGTFSWNGRPVKLDASIGEVEVRSAFGEPYWVDDDLGECLFFYEYRRGTLEWKVDFVRGRLSTLTILTPPLLADPGQREAYGITQPWPP